MERRSVENVDTIIGLNVNLKGNLKNQGSIQVNGSVEGEVRSDDNVNVGETAVIKGPVIAKVIEVSSTIKGLIEATEKLEINATGKVIGDINVKTLIIKQGAIFVGKSTMPDQGGEAIETKEEKIEEETVEEEKNPKS